MTNSSPLLVVIIFGMIFILRKVVDEYRAVNEKILGNDNL